MADASPNPAPPITFQAAVSLLPKVDWTRLLVLGLIAFLIWDKAIAPRYFPPDGGGRDKPAVDEVACKLGADYAAGLPDALSGVFEATAATRSETLAKQADAQSEAIHQAMVRLGSDGAAELTRRVGPPDDSPLDSRREMDAALFWRSFARGVRGER